MSAFLTYKALHIIFMVSWFAGLFYIVRLFIYHVEAGQKEEPARQILMDQFTIMEKRLWWIITTPAMVLTLLFGAMMLYEVIGFLYSPWMHLKLAFVVVLVGYHFYCQQMMFRIQKGTSRWTSGKLRLWNEGATLLLVAIVFIIIYKDSLNWLKATLIFFALAIVLMILIKLYKKFRTRKQQ
jgi:protoporphyrinogen IX oxidase